MHSSDVVSSMSTLQVFGEPPTYKKNVLQVEVSLPGSTSGPETSRAGLCLSFSLSLCQRLSTSSQKGQQRFCQPIPQQGKRPQPSDQLACSHNVLWCCIAVVLGVEDISVAMQSLDPVLLFS